MTGDRLGDDPELPEADAVEQQQPVVNTEAGEPDRRDPQAGAASSDAQEPAAAGGTGGQELPLEADVGDVVEQRRIASTADDDLY